MRLGASDLFSPLGESLIEDFILARYVVVDGTFIKRDRLSVDGKGPIASNAHVIFGWMAGDGADFAGSYPLSTTTQSLSIEGIPCVALSIFFRPFPLTNLRRVAANLTAAILASGLFPRPSTGNETLDTFNVTARIANDGEFVYAITVTYPCHLL
jgi:hypothetical protein